MAQKEGYEETSEVLLSAGFLLTSPLQLLPAFGSLFRDSDRWGNVYFTYKGGEYVSVIEVKVSKETYLSYLSPLPPFAGQVKEVKCAIFDKIIGGEQNINMIKLQPNQAFTLATDQPTQEPHCVGVYRDHCFEGSDAHVKMYVRNHLSSGTRAEVALKKKEIQALQADQKNLEASAHKLGVLRKELSELQEEQDQLNRALLSTQLTYKDASLPCTDQAEQGKEVNTALVVTKLILKYLDHNYSSRAYNLILGRWNRLPLINATTLRESNQSKLLMLKFWSAKMYQPGSQDRDRAQATVAEWKKWLQHN